MIEAHDGAEKRNMLIAFMCDKGLCRSTASVSRDVYFMNEHFFDLQTNHLPACRLKDAVDDS